MGLAAEWAVRKAMKTPFFAVCFPKPPSDEGGGKTGGFDGGRDRQQPAKQRMQSAFPPFSLPQSASLTAPSSEGAMGLAAGRGARKAPPASFFADAFQSLPLTREVAKPKVLTEGETVNSRRNKGCSPLSLRFLSLSQLR